MTDALVQAHRLFPNLENPEAPAETVESDPTQEEMEEEDMPTDADLTEQLKEQLAHCGVAWADVGVAAGGGTPRPRGGAQGQAVQKHLTRMRLPIRRLRRRTSS